MIHKLKEEQQDITSIRTSSEAHIHWKNTFLKNPFYLRVYADFEAVNEIDNSGIGNKKTII